MHAHITNVTNCCKSGCLRENTTFSTNVEEDSKSIELSNVALIDNNDEVKNNNNNNLYYLSKPKKNIFISINAITSHQEPRFIGKPDDFIDLYKNKNSSSNGGDENKNNILSLQKQMKNKVKKCSNCNKAVAFTLNHCNGCGYDISNTEITYTNNVFTSFIYGLSCFNISLRYQDEEFIVFDDPLALSFCHLNVIPTSEYIPDFRYLLKDPIKGLKLIKTMYELCFNVFKIQFWNNKQWRSKIFSSNIMTTVALEEGGGAREYENGIGDMFLRSLVAAGFNYPPSQYQLHLQFIVPPFMPFHYFNYLRGLHFTPHRFIPIEYGLSILNPPKKVNPPTPILFHDEISLDEIFEYFQTNHDINYDIIHQQRYNEYGQKHELTANFSSEDFTGMNASNEMYQFSSSQSDTGIDIFHIEDNEISMKDVQNDDKMILQNYGKPYDQNGKPTGTFYQYAKSSPDELCEW